MSNPLLDDLLAAFGTAPPKVKKPKAAPKPPPPPLPLPKAFSLRKTGYVTWKAVARVIHIQEQECNCCGSRVSFVKGEFFSLENGHAHAVWMRTEGYGIEAPEDLPIIYQDLEPVFVTACASCRTIPFDDLESLFHPRQKTLEL